MMDATIRDFADDVEMVDLDEDVQPGRRVAPPMTIERAETISDVDRLTFNDEYVYDPRPAPIEDCITHGEIDGDDMDWAGALGHRRAIRSREGATFVRIAPDVFVIAVVGAQFLHEDRHLADLTDEAAIGLNEHSWYVVVRPSRDQMLLVEVADGIYEHLPFDENGLLYMNTVNRHLVSRRDPQDLVVLVQVSGYGPDRRDEAVARLAAVLAARPDIIAE